MLKSKITFLFCSVISTQHKGTRTCWSGPEAIKLFPCSTQMSKNFILFIARNFYICRYYSLCEQLKFRAQISWTLKKFYNLGARPFHKAINVMHIISLHAALTFKKVSGRMMKSKPREFNFKTLSKCIKSRDIIRIYMFALHAFGLSFTVGVVQCTCIFLY